MTDDRLLFLASPYLVEFPLPAELVVFVHLLPAPISNVVLGQAGGEVNAIVQVPTPEYVIMGIDRLTLFIKYTSHQRHASWV